MEEPEEHIQPQPLTKTIHRRLGSQETINHSQSAVINQSFVLSYVLLRMRKILEEIITKPKFSQ